MIARTKKARAFVTAMLLVIALVVLVLPTVASAAITRQCRLPWRGSGTAIFFVYGRAYNAADHNYHWMEVHTEIWIKSGDTYLRMNQNVDGGDDISYLGVQTRWYSGSMKFYNQTRSLHEWDEHGEADGSGYEWENKESGTIRV
jgi:hypothetical protein